MRRRSIVWLLVAALLLALAAWLFDTGDSPAVVAARKIEFPRYMNADARQRAARRRSLTVAIPVTADAGTPAPAMRDPVLAALPPRGTAKVAVVVEANALVNSAIGQAFMECLGPRQLRGLEELRKTTGVDLLRDVDRIATTDGVFMASGTFGEIGPAMMKLGGTDARFGEHGRIWSPPNEQGGEHIAVWNDEMVLVGADRAELEAAIMRIEDASAGRSTVEPSIGDQETYGEIYGAVSPEVFDEIVPPELAARLREVADRVELHVSADDDLGLVVDIDGNDTDRVQEFARTLGGALALGRVKAASDGEVELAELLDLARVDRGSGHLAVELALPRTWLETRVLGPCRERAAADRAALEADQTEVKADFRPDAVPAGSPLDAGARVSTTTSARR